MNRYTIKCTEEQTKKAFELGAPIEHYSHHTTAPYTPICLVKNLHEWDKSDITNDDRLIVPTAEEMIGWLEEKGFVVEVILSDEEEHPWTFTINKVIDVLVYDTRKAATLSAIDSALDYLIRKGCEND